MASTQPLGIAEIYQILRETYGHRGWWPLPSRAGEAGFTQGGYHPGIFLSPRELSPANRLEITLGALLTQNTNWRNASRALVSLSEAGPLEREALLAIPGETMENLIRSSGYYRQKAKRIRGYLEWLGGVNFPREEVSREALLALKGVGPETADSILLYAYGKPSFVIDAYTKRILTRLGYPPKADYDAWQTLFHQNLPGLVPLYQDYHAQIVQLAKDYCRSKPLCEGCPLVSFCSS